MLTWKLTSDLMATPLKNDLDHLQYGMRNKENLQKAHLYACRRHIENWVRRSYIMNGRDITDFCLDWTKLVNVNTFKYTRRELYR